MRVKILLIVLFLATVSLYSQTAWYVSSLGSNFNSGKTVSSAFASINKAIAVSSCGDSIYVLGGVYHEKINAYRICTDSNRIVIQGDTTSRPLIIGDSLATNKYAISASGQGFTFSHLELTSPYPEICSQSNMVVVGSGAYMTFNDVVVRDGGYDGIKTISDCNTSTWPHHWRLINCTIVNNGKGCSNAIQNGDGIDFTSCRNCQVIGSSMLNNKGHQLQIKLEARNVTVQDCRIEGRLLFQFGLPGDTPQCYSTALNADSIFFRRNVVLAKGDTSEFVFKLADVSNLYIENNTIIKDSITSVNGGFICFGGCGSNLNWKNTPKAPVVIRNNLFANMSNVFFFAGPDTSYYDPFGITPSNVNANYNLFYDVNGEFVNPVDGGVNSMVSNPLFCDYPKGFELSNASPCINSGDPLSPFDPDATQSDIGAVYYQNSCTVSVNDLTRPRNSLLLYPNPANDIVQLYGNVKDVLLVDVMGRSVLSCVLQNRNLILDVSNVSNGVYFLKTNDDEVLKVIIQH